MVLAGVRQQDAILTGYIELFILIRYGQIQRSGHHSVRVGIRQDGDIINSMETVIARILLVRPFAVRARPDRLPFRSSAAPIR